MKRLVLICAALLFAASSSFAGGGKDHGKSGAAMEQQQGQQANVDQETIRQVQQKLDDRGYSIGSVDGIMGPDTEAALRSFQRTQGLEPSGQITQTTLQRLGVSAQQGEMDRTPASVDQDQKQRQMQREPAGQQDQQIQQENQPQQGVEQGQGNQDK